MFIRSKNESNVFSAVFYLNILVSYFLNRTVAMDAKTITFDFEANPPPVAVLPIEEWSSSSMLPSYEPSVISATDESMSSDSYFIIENDPQPFIESPEPSLSPSVFVHEMVYDNHMSYEPVSPISDNNMSYEPSPPLVLLPMLPQAENESDSQSVLPAFELAFMDTRAYEQFVDLYQPQLDVEMLSVVVFERSDRTLIYEEL